MGDKHINTQIVKTDVHCLHGIKIDTGIEQNRNMTVQ